MLEIEGRDLQQEYGLVYRSDVRMQTVEAFCAFCRTRAGAIAGLDGH
jgi:hypothetical protein